MDDGESEGDAAIGPSEVKVLKRPSERDEAFDGRCTVGWVVAKAADRVLREGFSVDELEADGMAMFDPLPNLAAGTTGASNIEACG
jgi:hypothetical protein